MQILIFNFWEKKIILRDLSDFKNMKIKCIFFDIKKDKSNMTHITITYAPSHTWINKYIMYTFIKNYVISVAFHSIMFHLTYTCIIFVLTSLKKKTLSKQRALFSYFFKSIYRSFQDLNCRLVSDFWSSSVQCTKKKFFEKFFWKIDEKLK